MLLQLEKNVSRLGEEVRHLKCIRRDVEHVRSFGRNSRTTVAKMFTLLDTNFRSPWRMQSAARYLRHAKPPENVFALQSFAGVPDFGDLYGMTALIMHLRCYWYYFKDSTIQLQRVDLKAPGVIIATARITITISDLTLQELFPHLRMTKRNREVNDVHRPSRERLLGRRFHCQCVITFFLDKESSRVAYISTSIDLVGSLLHSLA
ncbi:hypothetical protein F441_03314 [Phytophthora nicotianae CJ01A1]|uniref:Uncharacterized protein n=2 Tax=Phytophthora nicotianae TaxID=4792 RepID=W2XNR9_PHYNI|nr:hypothetical protein L916_03167 [Phytophthora nicotianae]ETP23584.1 hypothetical protein F441_03314 [Phytophthora nicotianae CJ01A1]